MGLITGQFGFFNWWARLTPLRIIEWGKGLVSIVADVFAIKAMSTHLGEAIFQDPTWQGRMIGILIRLARIGIGTLAEIVTLLLVGLVLIGWYILPVVAVVGVLK